MSKAKSGDTVKVHYTGKLSDGTVFDSSGEREPLQITLGEARVIPAFEESIVGMGVGESKTITIEAENAYGPHRDELVLDVERNNFPEDLELVPGQFLQIRQEGTAPAVVTILEVGEEKVKLDANHPLAGVDLFYEISLDAIV